MRSSARAGCASAKAIGENLIADWCHASLLGILCIAAAALVGTTSAAAAPSLLWQSPADGIPGSGAGQVLFPNGIGVEAATPGHLFVADVENARIDELDAWGQFERAWGWEVVASGPGNKAPRNAKQRLTVSATVGTYKLRYFNAYGGNPFQQVTAEIPFNAAASTVQAALVGLASFEAGDVAVSGGPGDGGGSSPYVIEFKGNYADTAIPPLAVSGSTLSGGSGATVQSLEEGGSFEICVPSEGDVCQRGQGGGYAAGQFTAATGPQGGVAVDESGDVYTLESVPDSAAGEEKSLRVQKFDNEGNFLLMWGGEVDKTTGADRCTKADLEGGEICGAGVPGSGPGQFEGFGGNRIAVGPGGKIFVGDKERIQEFDQSGNYLGQVGLPGKTVRALAMDGAGDFYVSYAGEDDVRKLSPAGVESPPKFKAKDPRAVAAGSGGKAYAVEVPEPITFIDPRILGYEADGSCFICAGEEFRATRAPGADEAAPVGLATSTACGIPGEDLYASFLSRPFGGGGEAFLRAHGPPPDPHICPPPEVAPEIDDQYATAVGTDGALLRAAITPKFWPDAHYYVEYGTGKCSEGGCGLSQPAPPGALLTEKVTNVALKSAGVALGGLAPDTTYHYRFVAESSGGGPVRGVGGSEAEDGAEGTFRTFKSPPGPQVGCPNDAFRNGPGALLPDCRAYEMVSPADKANADIVALTDAEHNPAALNQASATGDGFTYSAFRAFGDAQSAPISSQYMARRGASGWQTEAISPPRGTAFLEIVKSLNNQFKAFSADLCEAWVLQESPTLAPGAVEGFADLYRRRECEPGAGGYAALTTAKPPHRQPSQYLPELQGVSADGQHAIFRAQDNLTADAPELGPGESGLGIDQLYEAYGEGQLHFVCLRPNGTPVSTGCVAGTTSTNALRGYGREQAVSKAISADGSRVFWSDSPKGSGKLYVRENPTQPQSALAHGGASGTAKLTEKSTVVTSLVAAKGQASTTEKSTVVTLVETSVGGFVAGQPVFGTGIQAGTTILSVSGNTLTLSKAATATSSTPVTLTSNGPMPFAAGQAISAPGIPVGTTITAVAAGSLTLSAAATVTKGNTPLEAFSDCTEAAKACTVAVSVAAEEEAGTSGSQYWTAAADGSAAVFTTGDLGEGEATLHRYDIDAKHDEKIAGGVYGVMGASEDAKRIYFASAEALDEGASAGKPNLYLWQQGTGGAEPTYSFIATLSGEDAQAVTTDPVGPLNVEPHSHTAQVSADGLHAAFMSTASLTGQDSTDANNGKADAEVFHYDAASGELRCASCNPTGARPSGREIARGTWAASQIPGAQTQIYEVPRVLSSDGRRLFFESFQPLVASDTNGKADVYEWEEPGEGGCTESHPTYSPAAGGCVALISSGQSASDSTIADASPSGEDVFFATASSLLPQSDPDTLIDIYDARVGGGFPPPAQPPAPCEGEACQSPPAPPNDPTPASSTFEGAGNVVEEPAAKPKPCSKGKVRRQGRCVSKHRKKIHKRAKHKRRAAR